MHTKNKPSPTLPHHGTAEDRSARALQLSLARTAYNYVRTYPNLDAVPLCAGVPAGEEFSAAYTAVVAQIVAQIAENFGANALRFLKREIAADYFKDLFLRKDVAAFVTDFGSDVKDVIEGLSALVAESVREGPTAFLKSTLFDILQKNLLQAAAEQDYEDLFMTLPTPQMLAIEQKDWMPKDGKQCEQDWFFGYLQVAGFNTTNLRRVVQSKEAGSKAILWSDLQAKMSIGDGMSISSKEGDRPIVWADAIKADKLYACDYAVLIGDGDLKDKESDLHGKHRYLPAPIALFYWNDAPPDGYPRAYGSGGGKAGVLQPIAIQLGQTKGSAIFTPNDSLKANDANHLKWKIAKNFVNVACAIQHESVAHLGDCHLIIESIAVATHRQLAKEHPLYVLLEPHLRFTISINDGAAKNLIVPGGVVASNVGPNIHWTLTMVNDARKAWRWYDNSPDNIFRLRGVDTLADFPFRDDTRLLWKAIESFVDSYVEHYYATDEAVTSDPELTAWVGELCSPQYGNLMGLEAPKTRAELAQIVAQTIYIAGPQHASVNYPQYPLGSYAPSVAASVYGKAPTAEDEVKDVKDCLPWFLPLDVALYTISFEYLLSGVQFDVLGHYSDSANRQYPYFADRPAETALQAFQSALAQAEATIHARNLERPMPYLFQLPSRIPNSISI